MSSNTYYLSWSCVDGAGSDDEHRTENKEEAIRWADEEQAQADASEAASGVHEWNYIYKVRCDNGYRTFTVYNARTKERF